jgi:microcystin degradation protein MlrC
MSASSGPGRDDGDARPVLRVFVGALATETNTFAPLPTGLADFAEEELFRAGAHPAAPTGSLFSAPLYAAREAAADPRRAARWLVAEGLVASAQPAGRGARAGYEALRDELRADLRAALPVDVALLGLHGAMVAECYDDVEGDLLARVRALVGPRAVVGAELDPHAHLSAAMVAHATVLVAFRLYPHTDALERGRELAALCEAAALGRAAPVAAIADARLVVPFHTSREPAASLVQRTRALEGRGGVLSVSVIHGFALGDVADMGTRVLVYCDAASGTDADAAVARGADAARAQAAALAGDLVAEIIGLRDALAVRYLGVDEALNAALEIDDGAPAVIADRADNPGSGAPGDSTFILRRLLERRGAARAAVGPIYDPGAVRIAIAAGEGARLDMRIGGKIGACSGAPLDLRVTVAALRRSMTMSSLDDTPLPVGDAAWLRVWGFAGSESGGGSGGGDGSGGGNGSGAAAIDVVIISQRRQAMGTDVFTNLGVDLAAQRVVVVKSAQHFHSAFSRVCRRVFYCGAPGAASPRLDELRYTRISRPKWPLDADPWASSS